MNLVLAAVGKESLHHIWEQGNYDVVLFHYEEDGKNYTDGRIKHIFKKGFKFPLIKEYLKSSKKDYDYYLMVDDDVFIRPAQIETMFEIAQQFSLNLFHPAIADVNISGWNYNKKDPDLLLKFTSGHELMCLGASKNTLDKIIDTFDINKSGWGLPPLWKKLLNDERTFCIIDSVEIIHTRPHLAGGIYDNMGGKKAAYDELNALKKEFGLELPTWKVYQKVYNKPLLSILTIFRDEDLELLEQQKQTLPDFAQIVYVRTVPSDKIGITEQETNGKFKFITYEYIKDDFRFNDAMNVAQSAADGVWLMKLDSDERLLTHQHTGLFNELEKYRLDNVHAINMWCISCLGGSSQECEAVKQQRIYKKNLGLTWSGGAHEHMEVPHDLIILDSDFKIDHIGYDKPIEEMREKLVRNIRGMLKSSEQLLKYPRELDLLIRDCSNLEKINSYLKFNERKL